MPPFQANCQRATRPAFCILTLAMKRFFAVSEALPSRDDFTANLKCIYLVLKRILCLIYNLLSAVFRIEFCILIEPIE